ncbi:M28 family peptidase [Dyadobacter chenhuakuii]|uniref:M28 family peptidase n=1 Tax=Dyadobacter chenhuakuii TaxID=2909339 RepID=A0ABY4XHX0_9BACT|nr:M28 family peptidase [Dyadobacter chenhuakuii]MCF2495911.1 M28 family peptidase [Dyadobacter chenhuakuii]USJ29983.1 M28 family peptidase [Dyadobacter chenhuakuii]
MKFNKNFLLFICCLPLLNHSAYAQKKTNSLPEFQIKKADTEAHMRFLAADELLGRRTGEQGNLVAARYIAEQFRKLGVVPVPGNGTNNSTYFQNVPFEKMGANGNGEIIADAEVMKSGVDWILMNGDEMTVKAPIVYASFGLVNAVKNQDDYKDLDVKGKIVLVESGTAETQTPREIINTSNEKRKTAMDKGAIAVIELFNAPIPWNVVTKNFSGEKLSLIEGTGAEKSIPHVWINGKEAKYARALRAAKEVEFKTSGRKSQTVNSYNVVGYIAGTDPKLKEEYVLLSAHYDHIGIGKQGGQPYTAEDSIFNGARDNAFGTVALLTAAEALAKNPPKRSVLIVALTGEEIGLLGSKYYASHPLMPLNKCIFNINSDGAGYNDTTIVSVMGLDRTGARAEIEAACKAFGLGIFADPSPEQGLFDRSDNVNFAKEGIPAPTFTPGFKEFNGDIMKNYHQVSDNPETIDFNYLLKFSQAYAYATRLIADRKVAPQWSAGDKYEAAAKKLYGK